MENLIKKAGVGIIVLGFMMSFGATDVLANCGMCGKGEKKTEEKIAVSADAKTFQAAVICLGCTLKKEQGAKALCSLFGHKNALRTQDGKIWTILENKTSTELINLHDYAGKNIEVVGKKFADAQVIEVNSFNVLGEGSEHHHKE